MTDRSRRARRMPALVLASALASVVVLAGAAPATAAKIPVPWYSLQASGDPREADAAKLLGAKMVRIEFDIRTPVSRMTDTMKMYDDAGIRVLLLAGFSYRVATERQVENLASWARAFGPGSSMRKPIRHIEFGNETGFAHHRTQRQGYAYGKRCRQASLVLRSANARVKLLCQADDGNTGDGWIAEMYRAAPRLHRYVDGWVVHPYGTGWKRRVNDSVRELRRLGSPKTKKIDITEWGIASANGKLVDYNYGLSRSLTYDQAATAIRGTTNAMRRHLKSRLRYVVLYRARDGLAVGATSNPEEYFGMVNHLGELKGPIGQTAQSLLRSSTAP